MNGTQLVESSEERDKGILVQNDLKWSKQCAKVVSDANRMLGMIKRSFGYLNRQIVLTLYKSLVRPHLEHCVQVWRPHLQIYIKLIEGIQRRATKLLPTLKNKTYHERLHILILTTLETRRIRGDLIEVFKLLKGYTNVDYKSFFELCTTSTQGHSLKLYKKSSQHDFRKYCFSQRVIDTWNGLPDYVINSGLVNLFKSKLDKCFTNRGFI